VEAVHEVKTESDEVESVNAEAVEVKNLPGNKDERDQDSRDVSFASDAAGSADIATFVGETLDRMGEAIEDLNNFHLALKKDDVEEDGNKVVDGDDDLVSEGSWSVVAEDEPIGVEKGLGRAAQAIGSALFNSDMRSSENVSALTHSIGGSSSSSSSSSSGAHVSSVTSVPTTVRSVATTEVPRVQLERWAGQLEQLHELGFFSTTLCAWISSSRSRRPTLVWTRTTKCRSSRLSKS
jgi:hypothetical protein